MFGGGESCRILNPVQDPSPGWSREFTRLRGRELVALEVIDRLPHLWSAANALGGSVPRLEVGGHGADNFHSGEWFFQIIDGPQVHCIQVAPDVVIP